MEILPSHPLPDFAIIGAQKSGTTKVFDTLARHPSVCPSSIDETCFFSDPKEYALGLEYYREYFQGYKHGQLCGESTPNYLPDSEAARRLHATNPNAKLIAILRNPLERAYSAYLMQVSKGSEPLSSTFEEALGRSNTNYVVYGNYFDQLSTYYDLFSPENVLVTLFDDLIINHRQFFERIFEFVGLQYDPENEEDSRISNPGGMPKSRVVAYGLNIAFRARNSVRESKLHWLVDNRWVDKNSRRLRNAISTANRSHTHYPRLTDEQRKKLAPLWREQNERLSILIKRDLSHWNE